MVVIECFSIFCFSLEMSSLEHHRKFNPAVKVKGVMEDDQMEKRSSMDSQPKGKKDDDELGFDLFTAPVEELKKEKEPPKSKFGVLSIVVSIITIQLMYTYQYHS